MTHSASEHDDQALNQFLSEVKAIEKKDSIYTSKQQIERLLRPGSSYANLNPFDVLMLDDLNAPLDQVKRQYKKLSILLHPDKNPDDVDRAKAAFAVVTKAYKSLDDEESRNQIMEVVAEARHRTKQTVEEKRRRLKREGHGEKRIDEDDPEKLDKAVRVLIMKLFAENERKRRSALERMADQKKRKHVEEEAEKEQKREKEEWERNYEQSRESRISSWKSFQTTKRAKKQKEFRPPQHKAESR